MKKFLVCCLLLGLSFNLFSQTKTFEEVKNSFENFIVYKDLDTLRTFSITLDLFTQNKEFKNFQKNKDYKNSYKQLNSATKQLLGDFKNPWNENINSNNAILSTQVINEQFSYFVITHSAYVSKRMLFYRMLFTSLGIILVILFVLILFILNYKKEKQKNYIFTQAMLSGQEEEKKRISIELHDTLAQNLKVQKILLLNLKEKNKDGINIQDELEEAFQQSKDNITEIRSICQNLFPPDFVNQKLDWIIAELCENVKKTSGINCTYFADPESPFYKMENEQKLNLFRIIQEATNNAVNHSGCKNIKIYITKNELIISDDGQGFEFDKAISTKTNHFGLRSIKERSALLKTTLDVQSDEKGTNIHLKI